MSWSIAFGARRRPKHGSTIPPTRTSEFPASPRWRLRVASGCTRSTYDTTAPSRGSTLLSRTSAPDAVKVLTTAPLAEPLTADLSAAGALTFAIASTEFDLLREI